MGRSVRCIGAQALGKKVSHVHGNAARRNYVRRARKLNMNRAL